MLDFEWSISKAGSNLRKHGVAFEEASTAFRDPLSITIPDSEHSEQEARFLLIGLSLSGRLLVVSHFEKGDTIRVISARIATRAERREYEKI